MRLRLSSQPRHGEVPAMLGIIALAYIYALVAHIQRKSVLIAMRKVVREELAHAATARKAS
jgi:hypothetical protein